MAWAAEAAAELPGLTVARYTAEGRGLFGKRARVVAVLTGYPGCNRWVAYATIITNYPGYRAVLVYLNACRLYVLPGVRAEYAPEGRSAIKRAR